MFARAPWDTLCDSATEDIESGTALVMSTLTPRIQEAITARQKPAVSPRAVGDMVAQTLSALQPRRPMVSDRVLGQLAHDLLVPLLVQRGVPAAAAPPPRRPARPRDPAAAAAAADQPAESPAEAHERVCLRVALLAECLGAAEALSPALPQLTKPLWRCAWDELTRLLGGSLEPAALHEARGAAGLLGSLVRAGERSGAAHGGLAGCWVQGWDEGEAPRPEAAPVDVLLHHASALLSDSLLPWLRQLCSSPAAAAPLPALPADAPASFRPGPLETLRGLAGALLTAAARGARDMADLGAGMVGPVWREYLKVAMEAAGQDGSAVRAWIDQVSFAAAPRQLWHCPEMDALAQWLLAALLAEAPDLPAAADDALPEGGDEDEDAGGAGIEAATALRDLSTLGLLGTIAGLDENGILSALRWRIGCSLLGPDVQASLYQRCADGLKALNEELCRRSRKSSAALISRRTGILFALSRTLLLAARPTAASAAPVPAVFALAEALWPVIFLRTLPRGTAALYREATATAGDEEEEDEDEDLLGGEEARVAKKAALAACCGPELTGRALEVAMRLVARRQEEKPVEAATLLGLLPAHAEQRAPLALLGVEVWMGPVRALCHAASVPQQQREALAARLLGSLADLVPTEWAPAGAAPSALRPLRPRGSRALAEYPGNPDAALLVTCTLLDLSPRPATLRALIPGTPALWDSIRAACAPHLLHQAPILRDVATVPALPAPAPLLHAAAAPAPSAAAMVEVTATAQVDIPPVPATPQPAPVDDSQQQPKGLMAGWSAARPVLDYVVWASWVAAVMQPLGGYRAWAGIESALQGPSPVSADLFPHLLTCAQLLYDMVAVACHGVPAAPAVAALQNGTLTCLPLLTRPLPLAAPVAAATETAPLPEMGDLAAALLGPECIPSAPAVPRTLLGLCAQAVARQLAPALAPMFAAPGPLAQLAAGMDQPIPARLCCLAMGLLPPAALPAVLTQLARGADAARLALLVRAGAALGLAPAGWLEAAEADRALDAAAEALAATSAPSPALAGSLSLFGALLEQGHPRAIELAAIHAGPLRAACQALAAAPGPISPEAPLFALALVRADPQSPAWRQPEGAWVWHLCLETLRSHLQRKLNLDLYRHLLPAGFDLDADDEDDEGEGEAARARSGRRLPNPGASVGTPSGAAPAAAVATSVMEMAEQLAGRVLQALAQWADDTAAHSHGSLAEAHRAHALGAALEAQAAAAGSAGPQPLAQLLEPAASPHPGDSEWVQVPPHMLALLTLPLGPTARWDPSATGSGSPEEAVSTLWKWAHGHPGPGAALMDAYMGAWGCLFAYLERCAHPALRHAVGATLLSHILARVGQSAASLRLPTTPALATRAAFTPTGSRVPWSAHPLGPWGSLATRYWAAALRLLTPAVRTWWEGQESTIQRWAESYTSHAISPSLIPLDLEVAAQAVQDREGLRVVPLSSSRELNAIFSCSGAILEVVFRLHPAHPLRSPTLDCIRREGIPEPTWRRWALGLMTLLSHQGGSLHQAISNLASTFEKHFEGVEECPICYTVISYPQKELPNAQCKTCHKKFHSSCLVLQMVLQLQQVHLPTLRVTLLKSVSPVSCFPLWFARLMQPQTTEQQQRVPPARGPRKNKKAIRENSTLTYLLRCLVGSEVVIEMLKGECVRGILDETDKAMNLVLHDVHIGDSPESPTYPIMYVNSRWIRYFHLPDAFNARKFLTKKHNWLQSLARRAKPGSYRRKTPAG
ncbi:putative E3 ubiquitin-protein ligase listerin [Paratrimastix pyriformis]|uniref:E3 ubiquitin-protein ligase listerin n=1 Tax=Paratrimastix pyriformis TaxID=342808 RepID=A0ABQ8UU07_9EUKA|nr:putative E3 ubiquitin-protein ligase listerin [Paratrimastix pyriformis]